MLNMNGRGRRRCKMFSATIIIYCIFNICVISADKWFGPFKTILKDIKQCDTDASIIVNRTMFIYKIYRTVTDDGRILLHGHTNVTIPDLKQFKMSISVYESNVKKFTANNINCDSTLGAMVYTTMGLPVRRCRVKPGIYYFSNLDVNKSIHRLIPAVHYGPFEVRMEAFFDHRRKSIQIGCHILVGEHVPADGNNNKQ